MLRYSQLLSFEISTKCNLAHRHRDKCPIGRRKPGSRRLTKEKILEVVDNAYMFGFMGYITFHIYNEPLMTPELMFSLMDSIREKHSHSRFLLWTNGTILFKDDHFAMFEQTYCSNYFHIPAEVLAQFFSGLMIDEGGEGKFDDRLHRHGLPLNKPCLIPWHDFAINNQGDVMLCCLDWANEAKVGNVFRTPLKDIAERKLEIARTMVNGMTKDSPATCWTCKLKNVMCTYEEWIYGEAQRQAQVCNQ